MLGAADRRHRHAALPGDGQQQVECLARLHLPEAIRCIDRQGGGPAALNGQWCVRVDQPFLDAAQVDVEPGDPVSGGAVDVGLDERARQQPGVAGGNPGGAGKFCAELANRGGIVAGSQGGGR